MADGTSWSTLGHSMGRYILYILYILCTIWFNSILWVSWYGTINQSVHCQWINSFRMFSDVIESIGKPQSYQNWLSLDSKQVTHSFFWYSSKWACLKMGGPARKGKIISDSYTASWPLLLLTFRCVPLVLVNHVFFLVTRPQGDPRTNSMAQPMQEGSFIFGPLYGPRYIQIYVISFRTSTMVVRERLLFGGMRLMNRIWSQIMSVLWYPEFGLYPAIAGKTLAIPLETGASPKHVVVVFSR